MKRLDAIYSLIHTCGVFADIGCDHGLIARHALGFAKKVIAVDISKDCLSKAEGLLKNNNIGLKTGQAEFLLSDGFDLFSCPPDLAAVCGMGGGTIVRILNNFIVRFDSPATQFILQPQNDAWRVREFLTTNGYQIIHDAIVCDGGKFYDIIKTRPGFESLDEMQVLFGKFYKEKNDSLRDRLLCLVQRIQSYKPTDKNPQIIQAAIAALEWQNRSIK